jgi:hypothetical protein
MAPDLRDPTLMQVFGDAHRQTKQVIDGHMNGIRAIMQATNQGVADILLSILKSGTFMGCMHVCSCRGHAKLFPYVLIDDGP